MFDQIATRLLEGQFICEATAPGQFRELAQEAKDVGPALRVADEDNPPVVVDRRRRNRLCDLLRVVASTGSAADDDHSHIGTGRTQTRGTGAEGP